MTPFDCSPADYVFDPEPAACVPPTESNAYLCDNNK